MLLLLLARPVRQDANFVRIVLSVLSANQTTTYEQIIYAMLTVCPDSMRVTKLPNAKSASTTATLAKIYQSVYLAMPLQISGN